MALFSKSKNKKDEVIKKTDAVVKTDAVLKSGVKFGNAKQLSSALKKNWITEKSYALSSENKYVFIVSKNTNKPEVKKAVEKIYGVKAESVNIINYRPKSKRFARGVGKIPGFKKAIVQLKEGSKIEL